MLVSRFITMASIVAEPERGLDPKICCVQVEVVSQLQQKNCTE